jgi:hypothetical protein
MILSTTKQGNDYKKRLNFFFPSVRTPSVRFIFYFAIVHKIWLLNDLLKRKCRQKVSSPPLHPSIIFISQQPKMRTTDIILAIIVAWWSISLFNNNHYVTFYQVKAAVNGVKQLFNLPQDDIDKCVEAYQYLQAGTSDLENANSDSEVETEHIRRYYKVLQPLLSIADIGIFRNLHLDLCLSAPY